MGAGCGSYLSLLAKTPVHENKTHADIELFGADFFFLVPLQSAPCPDGTELLKHR